MENFDFDSIGVKEMNPSDMNETEGGGLKEWLIGKAIDAAVKLMEIYAEAYIEYSAETGGQYVIHHAY